MGFAAQLSPVIGTHTEGHSRYEFQGTIPKTMCMHWRLMMLPLVLFGPRTEPPRETTTAARKEDCDRNTRTFNNDAKVQGLGSHNIIKCAQKHKEDL